MRRALSGPAIPAALAGILSWILGACADEGIDYEAVVRELQAANDVYDAAIINQDRAALERIYSETYQDVGPDGAMRGKQEKIESLTNPDARLLSAKSDDVAVEVFGEAGLVTGRFSGRFMSNGQEVEFSERFSTLWVRDQGQWRLRYEQVSEIPGEK